MAQVASHTSCLPGTLLMVFLYEFTSYGLPVYTGQLETQGAAHSPWGGSITVLVKLGEGM